jgi:hypothetical protein
MGKAKFRLSTYRLEQLLGLPYNSRITEVIQLGKQFYPQEILIYVEHPDLPNHLVDARDSEFAGAKELVEIFPIWNDVNRKEFVDWGIPK